VIKVKFTVDVPAAWNREECDELTLWAHCDIESGIVLINGGHLKSSKPGAPEQGVPLSVADMAIAGYDLKGFKRIAIQEAHQSEDACALCARNDAMVTGTMCESCTREHGRLPALSARENAALLLTGMHAKIEQNPDARREFAPWLRAAEALFQDAAARLMLDPAEQAEEATAAQ
jgi:hypothetical protein